MSSDNSNTDTTAPPNGTIAFSGAFAPEQVLDQKSKDEFTVPLNAFNSYDNVVGENDKDGNKRLYMPGRLRKYIPVLYKQCWLNARAILSVNGIERVDGTNSTDGDGNNISNTVVTSDLRTSILSNAQGANPYDAVTVALRLDQEKVNGEFTESSESGMSKNVISVGPNPDGTARTLTCDKSARFMVNGGEYYNTYVFTEIGGMIQYVQGLATGDALNALSGIPGLDQVTTIYYVTSFEGFFLNTASEGNTNQVIDLNPKAETDGEAE
jgi:hypothetical protein